MTRATNHGSRAEIWPLFRDVTFEAKCIGAQMLRRRHLSIGQYLTLNWIRESGDLRASQLAKGLGISPPAATSLVSLLEARGWVVRQHSPLDRRGVAVRLTPRALPLLERLDHEMGKAIRDASKALSAEERGSMVRSLETLLGQMRARRIRDKRDGGSPDE
jgi:DNA-binding MarR family transcriptional regulator